MAKFISLFAGCGGIDLGMEQAGHECVAQVEWDKNAAGVLKHRWPNVPLFCDVSKVSADDLPDADFITYGFPCQDLSVAGKREGLDGKRSGLFYEATRLIRELRTRGCGLRFALAENVRGLMSADDGLALARCIRELLDCGASEVGFRILDSQYFGVAQRRKRVFIVSDFGGESVDEILAITESLPGYPAPSREAGKGTAGDATKGVGEGIQDVAHTLETTCHDYSRADGFNMILRRPNGESVIKTEEGFICKECNLEIFSGCGCDHGEIKCDKCGEWTYPFYYDLPDDGCQHCGSEFKVVSWNGDTTPKASEDVSVTLRSQQGGEGVGVAHVSHGQARECKEVVPPLMAHSGPNRHGEGSASTTEFTAVTENLTVRRLTPIECERLQGFPDNWTSEKMELILEGNEWKATGKVVKQADGPRYRQQGNAVTVNVAEWIGKQIGKVLNETK
jgi:DNA (cytosine-5)-methyltransferase 1